MEVGGLVQQHDPHVEVDVFPSRLITAGADHGRQQAVGARPLGRSVGGIHDACHGGRVVAAAWCVAGQQEQDFGISVKAVQPLGCTSR